MNRFRFIDDGSWLKKKAENMTNKTTEYILMIISLARLFIPCCCSSASVRHGCSRRGSCCCCKCSYTARIRAGHSRHCPYKAQSGHSLHSSRNWSSLRLRQDPPGQQGMNQKITNQWTNQFILNIFDRHLLKVPIQKVWSCAVRPSDDLPHA